VRRTTPPLQYATDVNLAARQRLWQVSPRRPPFELHPWVLALAGVDRGGPVLEVGCGNGAYLALVEATGVDPSLGMLRSARGRTSGPLVCAGAEALPLRDDSYAVVLAPHMLYEVDDRRAAARELRRVLRPGGTCVAATNSEHSQAELVALIEDVVGHGWSWRRPADERFSLENGADQLRAGFDDVERVDCPVLVVAVSDVDALTAYVASVGDHYEDEVSAWTSWASVVDECRRRVEAHVAEHSAFDITLQIGAFVCR
jgi:SAM-dependent methyltransferase